MIDRLNPFVKNDTLYTKTTAKYEGKYPDAVSKIENFTYIQTCYNKNGDTRKLEYISFGKQLSPGKFLKLEVKGQNVLYWEENQTARITRICCTAIVAKRKKSFYNKKEGVIEYGDFDYQPSQN